MTKFSDVVDKLREFKQELAKYGYEYIFYTTPGFQYPREEIYILSFGEWNDVKYNIGYMCSRNVNHDDQHEHYVNMKLMEIYEDGINMLKTHGDYKKGRPTAEKSYGEERCDIGPNEKV